jgi:hypothetical protein
MEACAMHDVDQKVLSVCMVGCRYIVSATYEKLRF